MCVKLALLTAVGKVPGVAREICKFVPHLIGSVTFFLVQVCLVMFYMEHFVLITVCLGCILL